MPNASDPAKLEPAIRELRELFATAARREPEVVALTSLPLDQPEKAVDRARALAGVGVTALVHASRYGDAAAFARNAQTIAERIRPGLEQA